MTQKLAGSLLPKTGGVCPAQSYSRDVLTFIFVVLTMVAAWKSMRKYKAPDMLNRWQTEEWKGWMQVRTWERSDHLISTHHGSCLGPHHAACYIFVA